MKHSWLVTKKDLLCFRWLAAAWLFYLLASLSAYPGWRLGPWSAWADASLFLIVFSKPEALSLLFAFVFIQLLVARDPGVESLPFWATRPVRPAEVLASKILGTLLVVTLPALAIQAVVWLWSGFSFSVMATLATTLLFKHAIVYLAAFPLALIANQAWSRGSGGLILGLSSGVLVSIVCALVGPLAFLRNAEFGRKASVLLATAVVAMLGVIWIVVELYLRRSRRGSVVAAFSLVALLAFTSIFWPWNFVKSRSLARFTKDTDWVVSGEKTFRDPLLKSLELARVQLSFPSLPSDAKVWVSLVDGTWTERGKTLAVGGSGDPIGENARGKTEAAQNVQLKIRPLHPEEAEALLFAPTPTTAHFSGLLSVAYARPQKAFSLPLREDAQERSGRIYARLERLEFLGTEIRLRCEVVLPEIKLPNAALRYFLVDTTTGKRTPLGDSSVSKTTSILGVRCADLYLAADLRTLLGAEAPETLAEAARNRLVFVGETYDWAGQSLVPFESDLRFEVGRSPSL